MSIKPGQPPKWQPAQPQPQPKPLVVEEVNETRKDYGLIDIPILEIVFLPPRSDDPAQIDQNITGDVHGTLADMRSHVRAATQLAINKLEQGSRYRFFGGRNNSPVYNVSYRTITRIEINEPYPLTNGAQWGGYNPPLVDYKKILTRVGIENYVMLRGVKQVWLWGYHGGKVTLWESNKASRYGNVSNSDQNADELPLFDKSYDVFHYNLARGAAEIMEDHTHHMEALLNYAEGRHKLVEAQWGNLLFWNKFVGSGRGDGRLSGPRRVGWTHYPPNARADYDWFNNQLVESDILDWRPDGSGQKAMVNCHTWGDCGDDGGISWKTFWLNAIPGHDNGLGLTNWWKFYGDWDNAMSHNQKLT